MAWRRRGWAAAGMLLALLLAGLGLLATRQPSGRVSAFLPRGEAPVDLPEISIAFDRPVAPARRVGQPLTSEQIAIRPAVNGRFVWRDPQTIVLYPKQKLPTATPFVVWVGRELEGECRLARDAELHFNTPPLQLRGMRQGQFTRERELTLLLEFNDVVRPEALEQKLALATPEGTPVAYRVVTTAPDHVLAVRTEAINQVRLVVSLAKGLCGTSGPLGLGPAEERVIQVDGSLHLEDVTVAGEGETPQVQVSTTQPVAPEVVAAHLTVVPPVAFTVQPFHSGFALAGGFAAGATYALRFDRELAARNGASLRVDVERTVQMPDAPPVARLRAPPLAFVGAGRIPVVVEAVNTEALRVQVASLAPEDLIECLYPPNGTPAGDQAAVIATRLVPLPDTPNVLQTSRLDLRELLGTRRGVFLLTAADEHTAWTEHAQMVMVSDLGLTAKRAANGTLLVWACHLGDGSPAAGASVSVWSSPRQKLAEGVTDRSGVWWSNSPVPGAGEPVAVVVQQEADLAYLALNRPLGLVKPTAAVPAALVYSDRRVGQPGERLRVRALLRPDAGPLPASLRAELVRPDGRVVATEVAAVSTAGGGLAVLTLPDEAPSGTYQVRVTGVPDGRPLGETTVQVAPLVPTEAELTISGLPDRRLQAGEALTVTVRARSLVGGDLAGRVVRGEVVYTPIPFTHPSWPEFEFGDATRSFPPRTEPLGGASLDARQEARLALRLPTDLQPPAALALTVRVWLVAPGVPAVTEQGRDFDPVPYYLGLARQADGQAATGDREVLRWMAVDPRGEPAPAAQPALALYQLRPDALLIRREPQAGTFGQRPDAVLLQATPPTPGATQGQVARTLVRPGAYEWVANDATGRVIARTSFDCAGPRHASWGFDDATRLELVPDQAQYQPGATARLLIKAPFAGRALITLEGDRVQLVRCLELTSNAQVVELPLTGLAGPDVYCTATVVRPLAASAEENAVPARACGAVTLSVVPPTLRVALNWATPPRAGTAWPVRIQVRNQRGEGVPAEVTVSAASAAACRWNLVPSPDPLAVFSRARGPRVFSFDTFSLLEPVAAPLLAPRPVAGPREVAGGISAPAGRLPVAWAGPVTANAQGEVEVTLDLPAGADPLQLQAIAVAAGVVGSSQQTVIPSVAGAIQAEVPEVVRCGDEFRCQLELTPVAGQPGALSLRVATMGPISRAGPLYLPVGRGTDGQLVARCWLKAAAVPGVGGLRLQGVLDGVSFSREVTITVVAGADRRLLAGSGSVPAGQSLDLPLPGGWQPGSERCWIAFSARPQVRLLSGARELLDRVSGDAAETVAAAFPTVALAESREFTEADGPLAAAAPVVRRAIARLQQMQKPDGSIARWPGGSEANPWDTIEATEFLLTAQRGGWSVPPALLDPSRAWLHDRVLANAGARPDLQAAAAYVAALSGMDVRSLVGRLGERRQALSAYARCCLAAALARNGERTVARQLLTQESPAADAEALAPSDSALATAMALTAWLSVDARAPQVEALVAQLQDALARPRGLTARERARLLVALAGWPGPALNSYEAVAVVPPGIVRQFTSAEDLVLYPALSGLYLPDAEAQLKIMVKGQGELHYCWGVEGLPVAVGAPRAAQDVQVRQRFLALDGRELAPDAVQLGQLLVTEVTVVSSRPLHDLRLTAAAPAGLIITAPTLDGGSSGARPAAAVSPTWLTWDRREVSLAADLPAAGTYRFHAVMRAITPGAFRVPPVTVQAAGPPELVTFAVGEDQVRVHD